MNNETQKRVRAVVSEVLGDTVDDNADMEDAGLDSLGLMEIAHELSDLGITLDDLKKCKTIEAIVKHLSTDK